MTESEQRRQSYNRIAALYDSARPGYPAALFDDILAYADVPGLPRILEVGSGTGQATLPLAERGCAVDCIEPGPELAAIARDNLAAYPGVRIFCSDFESYDPAAVGYDILLSATAFHWVAPEIRFRKARAVLKPGGALALFWHRPVETDLSQQFNSALQHVYAGLAPALARDYEKPPQPDGVKTGYEVLIPDSGCFKDLEIRKHYVATAYSAAAYVNLMRTWSDHLALEAGQLTRLCAGIEELIQTEFAGEILRETVVLLYLARRK